MKAIGKDIIRKYKLRDIEQENILYFDEINLGLGKNSTDIKEIYQVILTDIRIIYVMVALLL